MTPILLLLIIAIVSLLIIRVGTMALVMTGLSQDAAGFQALSAYFGVGFTTHESEMVVNHPVRRKIIRDLIVLGNIGLTGVLATVIVTAVTTDLTQTNWWKKILVLLGGLALVAVIAQLGFVRRTVDWSIRTSLKRSSLVKITDYDTLLRLAAGYSIAEITIDPDHPIAGKTLAETRLRSAGVVVLGIARADGEYIGAPHGDARVLIGDTLTIYARDEVVQAFNVGTLKLDAAA